MIFVAEVGVSLGHWQIAEPYRSCLPECQILVSSICVLTLENAQTAPASTISQSLKGIYRRQTYHRVCIEVLYRLTLKPVITKTYCSHHQ